MRRVVGLLVGLTLLASPAGASPRDPILGLPHRIVAQFACLLYHESRSTLSDMRPKDVNPGGQSGLFQIAPITWNRWDPLVGVHVPVWRATVYQQEEVAVEIWRNDGFHPWHGDGCRFS